MTNATNNGGTETERLVKGLKAYEVLWEIFWGIHPNGTADEGHAWAMNGNLRDAAELRAARAAAGKLPTAEPGIARYPDGRRETVIEREVRVRIDYERAAHEARMAEIRAGRVAILAI